MDNHMIHKTGISKIMPASLTLKQRPMRPTGEKIHVRSSSTTMPATRNLQVVEIQKVTRQSRRYAKIHVTRQFFETSGLQGNFFEKTQTKM